MRSATIASCVGFVLLVLPCQVFENCYDHIFCIVAQCYPVRHLITATIASCVGFVLPCRDLHKTESGPEPTHSMPLDHLSLDLELISEVCLQLGVIIHSPFLIPKVLRQRGRKFRTVLSPELSDKLDTCLHCVSPNGGRICHVIDLAESLRSA